VGSIGGAASVPGAALQILLFATSSVSLTLFERRCLSFVKCLRWQLSILVFVAPFCRCCSCCKRGNVHVCACFSCVQAIVDKVTARAVGGVDTSAAGGGVRGSNGGSAHSRSDSVASVDEADNSSKCVCMCVGVGVVKGGQGSRYVHAHAHTHAQA
jgi:hypothetical protein